MNSHHGYFCLALLLQAFFCVHSELHHADEVCDEAPDPQSESGSALLQVSSRSSPHSEDFSQVCPGAIPQTLTQQVMSRVDKVGARQHHGRGCASLVGRKYVHGSKASLNENGYQQVAALCCHHEMSLFIRREIANQGLDICDLSDLHGFVHWYDCVTDGKTYLQLKEDISLVMSSHCPWLGHLPNCPKKGKNCFDFGPCPTEFPEKSCAGSSAALSTGGYHAVALRCCHFEMEQFLRREIKRQGLVVCGESDLFGLLHWYDCPDDNQTYTHMKQEVKHAWRGSPCPWLAKTGDACPKRGPNCPVVEVPEPVAHRRRTSCR